MSTTFVGRQQELDELLTRYRGAVGGSPQLVLIGGDAGIGKSTLVQELSEAVARDGGRVLVGACMNFGGAPPPYLPFIDALRGVAEVGELDDVRAESSRVRLFERVLRTFEELSSEHPILLVLEDLHWADPSTLDVLSFLVRNLRTSSVLITGTYRTDDLPRSHPLRPVLSELRRSPRASHIGLDPFDLDEVRAQLTGLFDEVPDERIVRGVHERSDGVPFFVGELAACCTEGDGLPSSITQVVSTRLDRLDEGSRGVVEAAAIAGASVPHDLLATVTGLGEAELAAAVREAIGAAVLVVNADGRSYSFRHALLREVVKAEMLPGDRVRHNAAVADALGPDAAAERAWHWRQANRLPEALAASLDAAKAAGRVFAFPESYEHLSTAIELWDSVAADARPVGERLVDLLASTADTAALAGHVNRAVALARQAIELVPESTEPELAGTLWTDLARYLRSNGRFDESMEASDEALRVLPPGPSAARARAQAGLAGTTGLRFGVVHGRELAAEAAEMAAAFGDPQGEGAARNTLGVSLAADGHVDEGVVELRRSLALGQQVQDFDGIARAYINLSDAFMRGTRFAEALAVANEGGAELDRLGIRYRGALFLSANAAECEIELGLWDEARRRLATTDGSERTPLSQIHHLITSARFAVRTGDLDAAEALLGRAEPIVAEIYDAQFDGLLLHCRIELSLWRGEPLGALADASQAFETLISNGDGRVAAELLAMLVRAVADAEEQRLAHDPLPPVGDDLAALLERARPLATLSFAFVEAEEARAAGKDDPALWAVAAEIAGTNRPFQAAYARWREGAALLGRREPAAVPLREAAAGAGRLGARRLLEEITGLARRARVDLDVAEPLVADAPVSPLAGFGLTAREEEVLALLADGLSNREIGERLFISIKTASVHVSNILAKLGVGSRVQAATLAARVR